jgi:TrkA domain protein
MAVKEVELPGVGRKYTVETKGAGQLAIVLHRGGKREIYKFEPGGTEPSDVIDLTTEEAQQVGAILSQTYFQVAPDTSTELVMQELTIEWLTVPAGHELTGKSIRDLAIRARTGATIVAVLRKGGTIVNPDPGELLRGADTLMVIGNAQQVEKFKETFGLPAPAAV